MKKRISLLAISLLAVSCVSNRYHLENYKGQQILVGRVSGKEFYSDHFKSWFVPAYQEYIPDSASVAYLKKHLRDKVIEIYMGTWCPDSREHVPHMLKVLDRAGFPRKKIRIYALRRHYNDDPVVNGKDIIRVPTFIIFEDKKELGRIIEYPMESLEKDLIKILKGNYKHDYQQ